MPLIRGNLKSVKDVTDARAVLKAIANNPKFTEYGARRLVKWHKKLTGLAFAQKKNPDNSEPWAGAGYKTEHDKRFKGLLTQSGTLLKAATNPEVSISTKDGVTTANIRMPASPFYAEFHQFGTSNIHKNTALVFAHVKTKRVETSHKRSTRTPARPFFAFASDNFSAGSETVKEIEKTTRVVFDAVSESILKRALQLPTAEIEGYTAVVSFYNTAPLSNRVAKSGKIVTRKGRGHAAKHARLDSRTLGELYSTPGAQFHSALTESLQPPPKGPRTAKNARHAHYQELHRQSLAYRSSVDPKTGEVRAVTHARQVHAARTEGRGLGTEKLRAFEKEYTQLWITYGRAPNAAEKERIGLMLEELRIKLALETGAIFRENERDPQGQGRTQLNELVTSYKQHRQALEKQIEASKLEETKAKHRKALEAEHASARKKYLALAGKREQDPFRFESALNTGELAAQQEKRDITTSVHNDLAFNPGGRPEVADAHAARVHEAALERRRNARYEKAAKAQERPVEEIAAEAAQNRARKEQRQASMEKVVKKAYAGSLIGNPAAIKQFYESIKPEDRDIADIQLNKAKASNRQRISDEKNGVEGKKNLPAAAYRHHVGQHGAMVKRHAREAELAAEKATREATQAPHPASASNPGTKRLAEPKAPKAPAEPKAPAAPTVPKAAPPPRLSAADKAHNQTVRENIKQLEVTKEALHAAGNAAGVKFIETQVEALTGTLRAEKAARTTPASTASAPKAPAAPKAAPAPKYNQAQKTVLPHIHQRVKQLTHRAQVLSASVDELRAERNEVLSKGYKELAGELDALAIRRHNRVAKIHKRLIPDLLRAFEAMGEDALVRARSTAKNAAPKPDHTIRTEPK